jgi:hypothetical protein
MKKTKSDPVIDAIYPALLRAAKDARKLAEEMETPFYTMKKGKLVNLNPNARKISAAEIRRRQLNKNF